MDPGVEDESDAFAHESVLDDGGGARILPIEHVRGSVQQGDLAPEAAKRLGELAADRPAPDDGEASRSFGEGEDRFVGEVTRFGESRNGWVGGAGPAADAGDGTDFHAVETQRVSITPLQIDLTHRERMGEVGDWLSA